ncbi:PstS family phosphate ABC transporter substrate-binding protein [Aetokthonos hydrillicola Thurmond2011]|jgi:phosphate transport system substrate-binding protein|uniref:Phosphate-binding protein n=1 Tax=Aetokthonos hydrillicola Thurmond2011 TaxID=2712845 RepID=A0AAP5IF75_9CYAN|nr:PstS family phosphate ABC transporter substrate-binding protein [Aetokthonos hydrillicola]MBO3457250.1 PstS family phosphate ABC transporter substrate-binding protein [Aetokthonos hydrillicola CCALA 1050]MBW4586591.1 PstS family phosphate ABC transporter substrate-binding protein [Aetokthonos hydrillicola CCALA 1050]MDR9900134.1 PstS family phosphate ABC transporter substrate-binding protein [Aetokthonos hydrillicola Thurmond2011]
MKVLHDNIRFFPTLLMLVTFSTTGCSGAEQQKKQISIDGGTVGYPLHQAVAEEYKKVQPNAQISVAFSGTGGGMSKFCSGQIDIAGASRAIRKEEIESCKKKGIDFVELPVALDGIAVITNAKNKFVTCLSIEELSKIWSPKSKNKVKNWNQVNPNFPNQQLTLYAPSSDTGTFDYFTQAVNKKAKASRTDYTSTQNQNVLVQGISGDQSALGYVGISYYLAKKAQLQLIAVQTPKGNCEVPDPPSKVATNTYTPLSRPLFIYVSKKSLDGKPVVREFVNFYLDNSKKWVEQSGYVELTDEAYSKIKQKFSSTETGSKFKDAKPGQPITKYI